MRLGGLRTERLAPGPAAVSALTSSGEAMETRLASDSPSMSWSASESASVPACGRRKWRSAWQQQTRT